MSATVNDINGISEATTATNMPISIIVLGSIIFVISFLGCCGAIRENTCCTMLVSKHLKTNLCLCFLY